MEKFRCHRCACIASFVHFEKAQSMPRVFTNNHAGRRKAAIRSYNTLSPKRTKNVPHKVFPAANAARINARNMARGQTASLASGYGVLPSGETAGASLRVRALRDALLRAENTSRPQSAYKLCEPPDSPYVRGPVPDHRLPERSRSNHERSRLGIRG